MKLVAAVVSSCVGNPSPPRGLSSQRTGQLPKGPSPGGRSPEVAEQEKPRPPPGLLLLRCTATRLTHLALLEIDPYPSDLAEEAMPGDPKECRQHARRCAELASVATTPEAREQFLSLQQSWMRLAADLENAKPSLPRSTRSTPTRRSRPRSSCATFSCWLRRNDALVILVTATLIVPVPGLPPKVPELVPASFSNGRECAQWFPLGGTGPTGVVFPKNRIASAA